MSVGVGCEGGRGRVIKKPTVFDIHHISLGRWGVNGSGRHQAEEGHRFTRGPALALFVWWSSCTLFVAVERVDVRMRQMTVSWNWLEGLRSNFWTVTGPALGDVSAGWSTAKVNCLCFSGRPSLAKTAARTRDCSVSSGHWRSFQQQGCA